jgi:hypothetical protein
MAVSGSGIGTARTTGGRGRRRDAPDAEPPSTDGDELEAAVRVLGHLADLGAASDLVQAQRGAVPGVVVHLPAAG